MSPSHHVSAVRKRGLLIGLACVMAASACSPRTRPEGPPAVDYNTLTTEQLSQRPFYSLLEAVQTLRPIWLSLRGSPDPVQVYVDDNHAGGLEVLRTIRLSSVAAVRHIDGIQASARYGEGHQGGVILVMTRGAGR